MKAKCTACNKSWQVSALKPIKELINYKCPYCTWKEKHEKSKSNIIAADDATGNHGRRKKKRRRNRNTNRNNISRLVDNVHEK